MAAIALTAWEKEDDHALPVVGAECKVRWTGKLHHAIVLDVRAGLETAEAKRAFTRLIEDGDVRGRYIAMGNEYAEKYGQDTLQAEEKEQGEHVPELEVPDSAPIDAVNADDQSRKIKKAAKVSNA